MGRNIFYTYRGKPYWIREQIKMAAELWAVGIVIFGSFLGAIGSLCFKMGSSKLSRNIIKNLHNYTLMLGFSLYIIAASMYVFALRGGELSILYPLVSTTYIWITLLAFYFLNEKLNKWKWIGISLIIVGVTFIGLGAG